MPKSKSLYICNACGAESPQWFGRCPSCNAWDSLEEEVVANSPNLLNRGGWQSNNHTHQQSGSKTAQPRSSLKFSEISDGVQLRFASGYGELDRVLGGGIVPGSLVLIGGDPGIGKSTLLLQVANQLAHVHRILYVSAEESGQQVKLRASRLGVGEEPEEEVVEDTANGSGNKRGKGDKENKKDKEDKEEPSLFVLPETDLEEILRELESLKPQVAVIDSIQTLYFASLTSAPGSVAQVRECTSALMQVAKRENITLLIVGHVTKEGAIAGPRV
ncbi:MAG: AAA family ATPase, partial [Symploca sp. SIO1B1]|nr:AAA family ATPase [Symploca sp. SIO1B1]